MESGTAAILEERQKSKSMVLTHLLTKNDFSSENLTVFRDKNGPPQLYCFGVRRSNVLGVAN
jgi:hypothetical protein